MADTPRSPEDRSAGSAHDGASTWAGNKPLDRNWWWSPALMIVVGLAVAGYQYSAIAGEDGGIVLNWVLVVIGAGVVVAGLVSLRREWEIEQGRRTAARGGASGPDDGAT